MSGFKVAVPVSELVRTGKGGGGVDERRTKDAYRKEKDLEEERKLGLAPACVDVESGRDINPHIPQFITNTPWYVPAQGPTLKHQRPHWERQQNPDNTIHEWYKKGVIEGTGSQSAKPIKFRKGACENCGAMTHKKKDCFERPRKLGAKMTGEDIAPDEYIQTDLKFGWEAKRDRWNGYNPAQYSEVVDEYEKQEEVRKTIKAEKLKEAEALKAKARAESGEGEEEEKPEGEGGGEGESAEGGEAATEKTEGAEDDEDKYADDADMQTSVDMDSRTRITVRNLRIREDTAKYLYNLNENAPYYDPKSRSMRENPLAGIKGKEKEAAKFAGENFVRYTGEVVDANEAQVFAWQARCQGIDVHALAEPTKLEQLKKDFGKEKKSVKEETNQKLLEKYGGAEHLAAPPKELLLAQTETYVEYSRKGEVIKGAERAKATSRYEEDIHPGNHTSVFGSYWTRGVWGYRCCHSTLKNSFCIGEKGYEVNNEMAAMPVLSAVVKQQQQQEQKKEDVEMKDEPKEEKKEEESKSSSSSSSSSSAEESEEEDEEEKKKREEELDASEKRKKEREQRKRDRRREKRKRRAEKMGGKRKRKRHASSSSSSSSASSSDSDSDGKAKESEEDDTEDAKLQRQVAKRLKEERRERREANKTERERAYNTTYEVKKMTEKEKEAYDFTKVLSSDPMAKFVMDKRKEKD